MASSSNIQELLKCLSCKSDLSSALTLPCSHSFCHKCIKANFKQNKITCPRCSKEHYCPNGFEKTFKPSNLTDFLIKLNDKYFDESKPDNIEIKEGVCSECSRLTPKKEKQTTEPVIVNLQKCYHCKVQLCENCSMRHYNQAN